jgi:hypothetical protein
VSIVSGITKSSKKQGNDQESNFSTTDQVSRDAPPQLLFDCVSDDSISVKRVEEHEPNENYEKV